MVTSEVHHILLSMIQNKMIARQLIIPTSTTYMALVIQLMSWQVKISVQLFAPEWACARSKSSIEARIPAYKTSGSNVQEIIEEYRANELEEITVENACHQHRCH